MQKFNIVFVLLVIGGATAAPAPEPLFNLFGGITNAIGGAVNGVASLATNVVSTAGNVVGGAANLAGNVAGGVIGAAGNVVGGALNIAGNVAGGLLGGTVNLVGGSVQSLDHLVSGIVGGTVATLNGVGNLVGVIPTILASGISDGLGYIQLGADKLDIAGNIFGSNGITANLFGALKNVFVPLGKAVGGIVGTVTQIGGKVLSVPLKIVSWFSDRMLGVVGVLSKNPANLVTNVIANLSNLGSQIQLGLNDFFTKSSGSFSDSTLKAAITTARDAIAPAIKFIYEQVNTVSNTIYDILDKYTTGKNEIGTAAVNQVSELLAPLVTKFNTIFESGKASQECLDPIRNSILAYGQDALSYMTNCIDDSDLFNATEYAEISLYKIIDISQYTKDVKCSLMECIVPALMKPNDAATIKAARECLAVVTNSVGGLKAQVQAKIDSTISYLTNKLTIGLSYAQNCLNAKIIDANVFVTSAYKALNQC